MDSVNLQHEWYKRKGPPLCQNINYLFYFYYADAL